MLKSIGIEICPLTIIVTYRQYTYPYTMDDPTEQ